MSVIKLRLLLALFLIPVFSSVSLADGFFSGLAKKVDMALVGPGGEVFVYYKDGNDIVIRNCGKDYPIVNKREDCIKQGPENRVPVEAFKQSLKSVLFLPEFDEKVKPLSKDEVQAYRSADPNRVDELNARKRELEGQKQKILDFVKSVNPAITEEALRDCRLKDPKLINECQSFESELKQVQSDLDVRKGSQATIKKVNQLIDDIVDKQIGRTSQVNYDKDSKVWVGDKGSEAVYTLLKQYDPSKTQCGLGIPGGVLPPGEGKGSAVKKAAFLLEHLLLISQAQAAMSIESQIKSCAGLPGSSKTAKGVTWNLVSRKRDEKTGKFYEVWKDSKSGLIWGDTLDENYNQYNAEKACGQEAGKRTFAGVQGKKFELPSKEQFEEAEKHGIREVLPNMKDRWFWSSSVPPYYSVLAFYFSGSNGNIAFAYRNDLIASARCVSR